MLIKLPSRGKIDDNQCRGNIGSTVLDCEIRWKSEHSQFSGWWQAEQGGHPSKQAGERGLTSAETWNFFSVCFCCLNETRSQQPGKCENRCAGLDVGKRR